MSCQQDELYEAESRALARLSLPRLTVDEAQRLVTSWRDLPWWEQRFKGLAIVVKPRGAAGGSVGGLITPTEGVIEMVPEHLNGLYVCHEACHVLASFRYGNGTHSPWFARLYLQIVYLSLGSDAYLTLYEEFERSGIDHKTDG